MAFKYALIGSVLALSAATTASADYCINKDLINLGPVAHDVAIFITGTQPITWHYDGYPDALFTLTVTPAAGHELLHWRNKNGIDAPIQLGDLIHVGWCTPKPNNIVDMWWTNLNGGRIKDSFVYQIAAHRWNRPGFGLQWDNQLPASTNPAVISNVAIALSNSPYPLADLNRENRVLAEQLRPLAGATSFSVAPGASVSFAIPEASPGQWIVARYTVAGVGGYAESIDYVQFQVD